MRTLTILLALPAACLVGYGLWLLRADATDGVWRNNGLLEAGDAPALQARDCYVDSLGVAVPYKQRGFRPKGELP